MGAHIFTRGGAHVMVGDGHATAFLPDCAPLTLSHYVGVSNCTQALINALLAFDSYFDWSYPYVESIPFMCPMAQREERAFDNMVKAIDMQEAFERLAINNHKSFLPHLAVYKVKII